MIARRLGAVALAAALLTACGAPVAAPPAGEPGASATEPAAPGVAATAIAPGCDELRAERYAAYASPAPSPGEPGGIPTPAYATMDIETIVAWARQESGDDWAGVWIEPPGTGDLTVAFTGDVDGYRQALRERFGDEEIRVVQAERSLAELEALQREIGAEMGGQAAALAEDGSGDRYRPAPGTIISTGQMTDTGRVSVGVVGGDDATLAELTARYGAERICLEVHGLAPPMEHDGPVRPLAKVEGWRDGLDTDAHALLEIADDAETAARAWRDNVPGDLPVREPDGDPVDHGLYGGIDGVDFSTRAVVVWSAGQSGSCPGWLADVDARGGQVVVEHGSAGVGVCNDDYNPYRMVLAVERERLPEMDSLPVEARTGDFVTAVIAAYR